MAYKPLKRWSEVLHLEINFSSSEGLHVVSAKKKHTGEKLFKIFTVIVLLSVSSSWMRNEYLANSSESFSKITEVSPN